jgi:predicted nuclease with TOPRIM domain
VAMTISKAGVDALFAEARSLSTRYDELHQAYQARIDALQEQANGLAEQWKPLVTESQAAYEAGNRALAKALSNEYKPLNAECKTLNAEANKLRQTLHEERERVREAFEEAKQAEAGWREIQERHHEQFDNGEFLTVRHTDDPRYADGSYFVSYGERGHDRHVTVIYDEDGNYIENKP